MGITRVTHVQAIGMWRRDSLTLKSQGIVYRFEMGITRVTCPSHKNVEEELIDTEVIRDSIKV